MSDARLPAHLEVSALIRAAEVAGGFATVIAKGERDAGVILLLTTEKGQNPRLWERLPSLDGSRAFAVTSTEASEQEGSLAEYVGRRHTRDPDSWVIELDIPDPERFIADITR